MKMHLHREPGMSPIETRNSLIVRLKSDQNEIAWRDFVAVYEGFLGQMARRHGVPERHVADVTQQILMAIVRSIEGWKNDGNNASFRRWLSTVSRNVVIRFMTRERLQPGGIGGSDLIALLQKVEGKPNERKYNSTNTNSSYGRLNKFAKSLLKPVGKPFGQR